MNKPRWSLKEAESHFTAVVDAARQTPQTVTKRGKPVVVVVAAAEYDRLKMIEKRRTPSFTEHLLNMPKDDGTFERVKIRFREFP